MKSKHIDCVFKNNNITIHEQIHGASLFLFIILFYTIRRARAWVLFWREYWQRGEMGGGGQSSPCFGLNVTVV